MSTNLNRANVQQITWREYTQKLRVSRPFMAGVRDYNTRKPFPDDYESWSRDYQLRYEFGRQAAAMVRAVAPAAPALHMLPTAAFHEVIMALVYADRTAGDFLVPNNATIGAPTSYDLHHVPAALRNTSAGGAGALL